MKSCLLFYKLIFEYGEKGARFHGYFRTIPGSRFPNPSDYRDMEHVTSYPFQPRKRKAATPSAVMPMGLPEEQGVSSRTIAEFFRRMDEDKTLCPHGIVILRHGQRIAEGVWKPYSSKVAQMQFSLSKSVVGMAVGLAISEGLLSLNETMAKIFPDKLPPFYMGKPGTVTVKQLLTMSSGVKFNEMGSISEKDWVRGWLLSDCEFAPGQPVFL